MNFRKALALSLLAPALLAPAAHAVDLLARHNHTSTLLPDGNILVTGGGTDNAAARTGAVQVYNMATNTFDTWADTLDVARSSHTATVLADGRVLIAGGFRGDTGAPATTLEICNPKPLAAGGQVCTALAVNMSVARAGHTATLLSKGIHDGKVLLCGGQTGGVAAITATCDLFDPEGGAGAGAVTPAAPMVSARMGHAAVLLNTGKVFVTGGRRRNAANNGWLYEPMNEVYDPEYDVWSPKPALLQGRIDHTATVLNNGIVMIAGGYNSTNTYKCANEVGEECWTPDDLEYWGYPKENQDLGSHGYLDGAEFFDQNGERSVLGESTFGVAPYRVHKHSAALLPDGSWNMFGGYGGIVRTMYSSTPNLETNAVFRFNNLGELQPTSVVNFRMTTPLARAVSGRLVNADAYFARTKDGRPSFEWTPDANSSVKIYLGHSTATLDGFPVGTLIDSSHNPGDYDYITTLTNPQGRQEIAPQTFNSDSEKYYPDAPLTVVTSDFNFATYYPPTSTTPSEPPVTFTGSLEARIGLELPKAMAGVHGTVTITGGTIYDSAATPLYTFTIDNAGSDDINIPITDTPWDTAEEETGLFVTTITLPMVSGYITNLSTGTTIYAPINAAGDTITLEGSITYGAFEIHPGLHQPAFNFDRSDIVIREMIFSSALGFNPAANSWKDLSNIDVSPTLSQPVFNHTTILTPAADSVIIAGRNCEPTTAGSDCRRGFKVFPPTDFGSVFIPVHKNEDGGSSTWSESGKLASKRAYHTSTLLLTGEILTCGGSDGARPLATCEVMDPATKTWAPTGSMNFARTGHTATLLPNGNVLVAGGATPSSAAVNTAEIYYPFSKTWVLTTPMFEVRQNHTSTLLPDGNVLVAGGSSTGTYSNSAEVFISSNSYWRRTGEYMTTQRAQHTATLLRNGLVLVAGGINSFGAVRETETYNYRTGQFTDGPAMNTGRYIHTANLLRDGRVIVLGGSDNEISQFTAEVYNGTNWTYSPAIANYSRANHRSVLLPNGKLMVTGGEVPGAAQEWAEGYDPDFPAWSEQGQTEPRTRHTTVLTTDNYVINIGGWDGSKYLDTTDLAYFSYSPDLEGLEAERQRNPLISTGTVLFDRGDRLTLQSGTTNFHGFTEASGGGAGPMNSSYSNPRVYMQQIDNQSGYMIDMSTYIYKHYGGFYSTGTWETTLSSITIVMPQAPWDLPHGWYHVRVAANGQFSPGFTVQVTTPRPSGLATMPQPVAGSIGLSSITWTWNSGTISAAEGYVLYAASNSVFITTMAFVTPANYTQTGLSPNTAASVMVSAYNLGGYGPLSRSSTFYTLAAPPANLSVTGASFDTVRLHWSPNGNSAGTVYEVSMCGSSDGNSCFSDPLAISTPVPFSVGLVSTSAVISPLVPDTDYFFRVRARNGAGIPTVFNSDLNISTLTVSEVKGLYGAPYSSTSIRWAWTPVTDPGVYYEIYDITAGSTSFISSATTNSSDYILGGLLPNTSHLVMLNAAKLKSGDVVRGPTAFSAPVFTKTVTLSTGTLTAVSTTTLLASWIVEENPAGTNYTIAIATTSGMTEVSSYTTNGAPLNGTLSYLFTDLMPNTRYFTTVTAVNGGGYAGPTLNLGSRYTLANPPARVIPLEVSMSGVMLGWETSGNSEATIYEVRSSTTGSFDVGVTTHVPFSSLHTDNYVRLTGLLTATTYYFVVRGRNGDAIPTLNVLAAYEAGAEGSGICTLPGPGTSPTGSVGGTSGVGEASVITGTLPDGRTVSLYIPAGAFPTPTAIAISSSATSSSFCGDYKVNNRTVEVEIFSQNGAQPQLPVQLTVSYNGILPGTTDSKRLVLARYNPVSGQCLPLETQIDTGRQTATATLNHFSLFKLMLRDASASLADVLVYPNPFYTNRGNGFVTIANIPASAKVRVYTLSGEKVWEGSAGTTGLIIWRGVNKYGELVASGIYLAVIDSSAGKKVVKIAVER